MKTVKYLALTFFVLSLSSCLRLGNYTCTCENFQDGMHISTATYGYSNMSESDAEKECDDNNESSTVNGSTFVTDCFLVED